MTAYVVDSGSDTVMLSRCDACGSELKLVLPVNVDQFAKQTKPFAKAHERCRPDAKANPTEPGESPDATSAR